jgi:hypothetical protein
LSTGVGISSRRLAREAARVARQATHAMAPLLPLLSGSVTCGYGRYWMLRGTRIQILRCCERLEKSSLQTPEEVGRGDHALGSIELDTVAEAGRVPIRDVVPADHIHRRGVPPGATIGPAPWSWVPFQLTGLISPCSPLVCTPYRSPSKPKKPSHSATAMDCPTCIAQRWRSPAHRSCLRPNTPRPS